MSFSPLEEEEATNENNSILEFTHPLQTTVPAMLHQDLLQYNNDRRLKEENASLLQQRASAAANILANDNDDAEDSAEAPVEESLVTTGSKRTAIRTPLTQFTAATLSPTRPSTASGTTTSMTTTAFTSTANAMTNEEKPFYNSTQAKQPSLSPPLPQISTTWERSPFFRDMMHERDHPHINWIEPPCTPLFLTPWYQKALLRQPWFVAMCSMFIPGSGHALIGQYTKAVFYMTSFYTMLFTCLSLSLLYIGLFTLPFVALVYGVIIIDAHYMSVRLFQYNHPIMQGECAYSLSTWGLNLVMDKVFVTGDMAHAPEEYVNRMQEQYGGDNSSV